MNKIMEYKYHKIRSKVNLVGTQNRIRLQQDSS